jgi:hypothetical protein
MLQNKESERALQHNSYYSQLERGLQNALQKTQTLHINTCPVHLPYTELEPRRNSNSISLLSQAGADC